MYCVFQTLPDHTSSLLQKDKRHGVPEVAGVVANVARVVGIVKKIFWIILDT